MHQTSDCSVYYSILLKSLADATEILPTTNLVPFVQIFDLQVLLAIPTFRVHHAESQLPQESALGWKYERQICPLWRNQSQGVQVEHFEARLR